MNEINNLIQKNQILLPQGLSNETLRLKKINAYKSIPLEVIGTLNAFEMIQFFSAPFTTS